MSAAHKSRLVGWAFNGAAAVSAVLCVGLAIAILLSYRRFSAIVLEHTYGHGADEGVTVLIGVADRGRMVFWFQREGGPLAPNVQRRIEFTGIFEPVGEDVMKDDPRWAGFSFILRDDRPWGVDFLRAGVPVWVTLPACALWLVILVARFRRRKRIAKPGLCRSCGYDLRATPDRCPECGAACKAANPAGESPAAGS